MADKALSLDGTMIAVIIPIYKQEPEESEKKSLEQCLKVLGARPIIFFCAHQFDCSYYQSMCNLNGIPFEKRTFDDKYFRSKEDYNVLCLTSKFYSAFVEYHFVLIYQLDAYVFSDQLNY